MPVKLPWYIKISAKVILSRLPISYDIWRSLGLFRNGPMDELDYPVRVFSKHAIAATGSLDLTDKTVLELGTGDSVASALVAAAAGAEKIYLIDVGAFASRDMRFYAKLAQKLSQMDNFNPPDISETTEFDEMLDMCHASYLTQGLQSLRSIEDNSVDFIWSHSCLEHVRKYEFDDTMLELGRILKPDGTVSHNIDLKDHLEHSLHNLRFSEALWESNFMVKSGFYTNRLRPSDFEKSFQKNGFEIQSWNEGVWPAIPLDRQKMHSDFKNREDRDLLVRTVSTRLKKAA